MCSNDLSIVFFVMKKHYLYAHTRNDTWAVFYIGIGTQSWRSVYGRAKELWKHNRHRDRIYAKAWRTVHILCESDNYDYIKQKEVSHIKYYGRGKGGLCNQTDWGDGSINPSEEVRAKISSTHKWKTLSSEQKSKIWLASKARMTLDARRKISIANSLRVISQSTRDKISLANKWKKKPPFSLEHKANIAAAAKLRKKPIFTHEHRAKISAAQKLRRSLLRF